MSGVTHEHYLSTRERVQRPGQLKNIMTNNILSRCCIDAGGNRIMPGSKELPHSLLFISKLSIGLRGECPKPIEFIVYERDNAKNASATPGFSHDVADVRRASGHSAPSRETGIRDSRIKPQTLAVFAP